MRKKQRAAAEPTEEPPAPGQDAHETVLQLVQRFNTDDWQGKKVYLYRVWPVIDKKSDDHFIAKLSEAFDEDYLLKNCGSGRYHLRLNDAEGSGPPASHANSWPRLSTKFCRIGGRDAETRQSHMSAID